SPGYGGVVLVSGSWAIVCAFAIAELSPAKFKRGTAMKMMERIQSLGILGTVPYGRSSARSIKKKIFNLNTTWGGQTSTAAAAPYYMAGKISGGSSYFDKIVSSRFLKPPYGDVDGGHGTHTIPFILGSIAISNCDPQAHKNNMNAFLWKLTTHRGFDGFIVNNSNPMEHHTGEAVMGKPWWSTGAYLILLNAHKHNMAMTGEVEYMASYQKELPLIHDIDMKVYRHVLRQWNTVEAALGKKTPRSVSLAIKKLATLKEEAGYGMKVFAFLEKYAVRCARDVNRLRLKNSLVKTYCVEILLGVDHEIFVDQHNWQMKKAELQKLAKKAKSGDYETEYLNKAQSVSLKINSKTYFTNCNGVLPMTSQSENPLPKLISKGTLRIVDGKGRAVKGLPREILLDNKKLLQEFSLPRVAGNKLYALFNYKCGGVTIKYKRELVVNSENNTSKHLANIRSLWIPGILRESHKRSRVDIVLPRGRIYNGTFPGKAVITDAKGKVFKDYVIRWANNEARYPLSLPLSKGGRARFLVSAGSKYEGFIHEVRVADPEHGTIKKVSFSLKKG
ncbi:MAG: hypothetical protein HRT88_22545, partial [Lentisphaeraceae bacterium]|nr:hypothetical protein [Lentisphaeraceae bacterium]